MLHDEIRKKLMKKGLTKEKNTVKENNVNEIKDNSTFIFECSSGRPINLSLSKNGLDTRRGNFKNKLVQSVDVDIQEGYEIKQKPIENLFNKIYEKDQNEDIPIKRRISKLEQPPKVNDFTEQTSAT